MCGRVGHIALLILPCSSSWRGESMGPEINVTTSARFDELEITYFGGYTSLLTGLLSRVTEAS